MEGSIEVGKLTALKNMLKKAEDNFKDDNPYRNMKGAGTGMKEDLTLAWNELEEVTADFDQITTQDLVKLLPTIKSRVIKARDLLAKYVSDKDVETYIGL